MSIATSDLCYGASAVRVDLFDFVLPSDRIAQRPVEPRDASRMLVVDPSTGSCLDEQTSELTEFIDPGTVLVVNDTRVIPARLFGKKAGTGGKVELLLVRKIREEIADLGGQAVPAERWTALGKASKPLRLPCSILIEPEGPLIAMIERRSDEGLLEVVLACKDSSNPSTAIAQCGHIPLPPYIRRDDEPSDVVSYQTAYARIDGAVAAPTAGLHLTNRLLGVLSSRGVEIVTVTLHVGPGTFQSVQSDDLDSHTMHEEWYDIPQYAAQKIKQAHGEGRKVFAVGTTSVRALESAAMSDPGGSVRAGSGTTRLLIQPGYRFAVVDGLLTNFHLPRSTLLALVGAFAGRELILRAYAHAIATGYRFYSYGDAMLIRCRAQGACS